MIIRLVHSLVELDQILFIEEEQGYFGYSSANYVMKEKGFAKENCFIHVKINMKNLSYKMEWINYNLYLKLIDDILFYNIQSSDSLKKLKLIDFVGKRNKTLYNDEDFV